jgi:hypothetical protein
VWVFGTTGSPSYTRFALSPSAACMHARLYLRRLVPGKPLVSDNNGCKELHVPLLHQDKTVGGVRVDPEDGTLLPRGQQRCTRQVFLNAHQADAATLASLRDMHVGRTAWQGGHGSYWNVPLFKNGKLIDILRIDMRTGELLPLASREAERQ